MTFAEWMQIVRACYDESHYDLEHRMESCDQISNVRIVINDSDRGSENKRVQSEFDQGCMSDSSLSVGIIGPIDKVGLGFFSGRVIRIRSD